MTIRFDLKSRPFSGGTGIRSIVGCLLAANLVGALPAAANTPVSTGAESGQSGQSISTLPPDLIATSEGTQEKGDDKAKPSSAKKAIAGTSAESTGEKSTPSTKGTESKSSGDKQSKTSSDDNSPGPDEKRSKISDDSKSKESKSKATSDSTEQSNPKASGEQSDQPKMGILRKAKETLIGKDKEEKAIADTEPAESQKAENKANRKTEDKVERKADDKVDRKAADKADRTADRKADGKADRKADDKADRKPETQTPAAVDTKSEAAPVKAVKDTKRIPDLADEEEDVAPLLPDAGLISILKDVSRFLKDSEEVAKVEDPCQKAAISVGTAALAKAVENPDLIFNRIITPQDKERFKSSMTVESWASGDIQVSPQCHASLSAVWGKKVDGLVNVAIAGNCNCKNAPDGNKVGEFVLVLNARSTVDTGFDIQSQSDVNFWLGKLTGVGVDTSCCTAGQAQAVGQEGQPVAALKQSSQRSLLVLKSVMTERSRKHTAAVEAMNERRRQLVMKAEEDRINKEEEVKLKAETEARASAEADAHASAEAQAKANSDTETKGEAEAKTKSKAEDKLAQGAKSDEPGGEKETFESGGTASDGSALQADSPRPGAARAGKLRTVIEDPRTGQTKTVIVPERKPYSDPQGSVDLGSFPDLAMATPSGENPQGSRPTAQSGWDSPAPPPAANMPSPYAQIMVPQRAIAGQFLTTAVLNPRHAGEHSVELSFNGATLATAQDGKALYMVPEDALPGPTLHVSLVARPESPPMPIHVLQPLATPTGPQVPRIDRVSVLVPGGGTITIDGHNFDGVATRNSIIIDGMWHARVLVSSPVELKADLPPNLQPGAHAISVNTGGLRSNPGQFEVVIPEVQPLSRETAKESVRKLIVRASGTKIPVRLRVRNHSPETLRITKGNDLSVLTPGGTNNSVLIDVQRLRPGAFNVDATME